MEFNFVPRRLTSPDRLFDRTWRAGHPFGPRLSKLRRIGMMISLLLLGTIIGGYWYVTDSNRVRSMAMGYLSSLIGGRVTIGEATLSIFQGLRLNDVRVYTAAPGAPGNDSDDSLLFRAQAFLVHADPKALLSGRLEATQIVVVDPFVRLTQDLETGKWEHEKLHGRFNMSSSRPSDPNEKPPRLPELILRNAQVETAVRDHGIRETRGMIALEGQFSPGIEPDVYLFKLQSRGSQDGIGPSMDGRFAMSDGTVSASLNNFRFGADLEAMLPAQVRKWWKDHAIAGRVDVPELTYKPARRGSGNVMSFRAEIDVRGVGMTVQPNELLGAAEASRQRWSDEALDAMRSVGLDAAGFVSQLHASVTPSPILMRQVTGKFVFTEDTIDVSNVSGYVESNGLSINAHIDNYADPETATASIRLASLEHEDIVIPASPTYMNSMPLVVQEIYDHLRPQGTCRLWVQVKRDTPSARPTIDGEINVVGGDFIFDEFPYPIHGSTGKLVIGRNADTGAEQLEILDVTGHGPENSVNKNAYVKINGLISPFGEETGVNISVIGENVIADSMVVRSLPEPTQQALRMFDAPGKGEYPKFRGGFRCDVERPKGLHQHWKFDTHIRLDDASGVLVVFPYPMSGVTGDLHVLDDRVEISNVAMNQNGATLALDGEVAWGGPKKEERPIDPRFPNDDEDDAAHRIDLHHHISSGTRQPLTTTMPSKSAEELPPLRTNLKIAATNVPIDDAIINALPPDQRGWLKKSGMTGKFDLNGQIVPQTNADGSVTTSEPIFDFHIALKDGAVWPTGNAFAATAMNGQMQLSPGRVTIESMTGKRGEADVSLRGNVDWSEGPAKATITANAKNLALDPTLYSLIPAGAQEAWNAVQPKGAVDVGLVFSGLVDDANANQNYELTLLPRQLSVTPTAMPYAIDNVTGTVIARPDKVLLNDITGTHGKSKVRLAGTGTLSAAPSWDFKLSADDVPVDDAFIKAAPSGLVEVIKSTKLSGNVGFTFDRLIIASPPPSTQPTSQPVKKADDENVDFAVRLNAEKLSMDVGLPLTDGTGSAAFSGISRGGKLEQLDGTIDFNTITLAGKPAGGLKATLQKPAGQDSFRLSKLETHIADGELAGQFDCALGDNGPTRYAAALVLRNADVTQLTGDVAPDVRGRLSASLSLEGAFNDIATRRGRGDVNVSGQSMYRIPLLLGLLQITNLALPITSPFSEATARYSVDGNKVAFESIELRAKDMMMQGHGKLDFGTKQVQLTFTTDNTTWPKLPIIGDLISGARHELLQINVRGTLQEPKVSAGAFNTLTTTVDEVFKGNDTGTAYNKVRK